MRTGLDENVCPAEQHSRNQSWAGEGVGRGPGGPPHESSQAAKKLTGFPTAAATPAPSAAPRSLHLSNGRRRWNEVLSSAPPAWQWRQPESWARSTTGLVP